MVKSLTENWSVLKSAYGTHTGLNLWVDYRKYMTTTFTTTKSLTQQINTMSELKNRIVQTGLPITDSLHMLNVLQALPASYEIVQQTILTTVTDFSMISWPDIQSCILSEELHQGRMLGSSTIRAKPANSFKTKCNYCGGTGHWEKECC